MEAVAAIVGAFLFFLVVLPLFGIGVSLTVHILVPYLFGGQLIYLLLKYIFPHTGAWWELAVPLFSWAALVLGTRLMDNHRLPWYNGHWRAVLVVLTFGIWRKARPVIPYVEEAELSTVGNF